ncbi:MAG: glycogen/starch/alpha-glucan phosphorylase [Desulfobacterales bacterium]|nr:glycogen/starch/alpha-glucan phosphorylase [Desulfobacterales bacterium]
MDKKEGFSSTTPSSRCLSEEPLIKTTQRHIVSKLGCDIHPPRKFQYFQGLAYSVRDRLINLWLQTQRAYYDTNAKRVYYLSLEFLPGRFLMNYITNIGIEDECHETVNSIGLSLEELEEEEWDAGLGNGGLGRLASCFMDSMATLKIPGYGYGIRYDFGIFFQTIVNGYQKEQSDNWLRRGDPWGIIRRQNLYEIKFYGRSVPYTDVTGSVRYKWVDSDSIMAMACDILVPGYNNDHVTNMRLWSAQSSREFNLEEFNVGDYIGAVEYKIFSENLSKVLYPSDEAEQGKELRLKQQYFFVAATFQDILRRHKKHHKKFDTLSDMVAIQLNDTHPAIAIPELMRILLDEEALPWEKAWHICNKTFAYTNHTVMPEALETWPVSLMKKVLPRHLEIIYEINHRFLKAVGKKFPGDMDLIERMSIFREGDEQYVRMANLAIVGSHTVNGVAALHTQILKNSLFRDFDRFFPGKIRNVTNGITPRRWLLQVNPWLSELITNTIGEGWVDHLEKLSELIPYAEDQDFRALWFKAKRKSKKRLAKYVLRKLSMGINPDTLFDIHVKRMHEYKRQLLNVLHVITLYNRIKENSESVQVPRTIMFAGKAAPGYFQAKLIIKLINSVADTVNNDPDTQDMLKVLFLPNYCISQAEKVIPAADLSEQISTAGMEASGTGNMKFALNGALTIGTLDGANVEIREEVGEENIFIFGLTADEVVNMRTGGYNPKDYYHNDLELKQAIDMIAENYFIPSEPDLFGPIIKSLLRQGDYYMVLADYRSYIESQEKVSSLYLNREEWTRKSILNTANMGYFSSDRAIMEYAENIWNVKPLGA